MKRKFSWYYPLNEDEIKTVWDQAILTVDANVLLDLYRYHEDTRDALLAAIKKFQGRAWLSYQTAEEFFRNRKKVIVSSINSYNDALQNTSDIRKEAEGSLIRLKNNRMIPDQVADSIRLALHEALSSADTTINESKDKHPDFLKADPILDSISELFNGFVGDAFNKEQLDEATKEGKRRLEAKVPPGFLDSGKDGIRPYGDYFMWRQILEYAGSQKKDVIFVTSEGKEDWWEKASGKTTGLHYELLKEAYELTGHRLFAYQTDRFFRFSEQLSGGESNVSAAEEISALVKARSTSEPLLHLVTQTEITATHSVNTGRLVIKLLRPVFSFTCSGHLEPNLSNIPKIDARLVSNPEEMPKHKVRSGAGTTFDFNLHVNSIDSQKYLPVGEYVFEYEASAPDVQNLED